MVKLDQDNKIKIKRNKKEFIIFCISRPKIYSKELVFLNFVEIINVLVVGRIKSIIDVMVVR